MVMLFCQYDILACHDGLAFLWIHMRSRISSQQSLWLYGRVGTKYSLVSPNLEIEEESMVLAHRDRDSSPDQSEVLVSCTADPPHKSDERKIRRFTEPAQVTMETDISIATLVARKRRADSMDTVSVLLGSEAVVMSRSMVMVAGAGQEKEEDHFWYQLSKHLTISCSYFAIVSTDYHVIV